MGNGTGNFDDRGRANPRTCQPGSHTPGTLRHKCVLYVAPTPRHFEDLETRLAALPGCSKTERCLEAQGIHLGFTVEHEPLDALRRLHREYYNLVVIDLRTLNDDHRGFEMQVAQGMALLDAMDNEPDIEARYGFHRIIALVSGDNDRVDRLIAALGRRRIGRVLRERSPANTEFESLLLEEMLRMILGRRPGLRALLCAGGGITGIYFEMGALKCLDDCLDPPGALNDFDMFFGISAGAVVSALIANGYTLDDGIGALAGLDEGAIPPMSLSLFKLALVDVADLRQRATRALRSVAGSLWRGASRPRVSLESLFLDYSDLLGPPLRGNLFEEMLRRLFELEGRSNDFRQLQRRLFIGATDQDLKRHVLFGDVGHDDVPISRAVQASIAVNPAFSSIEINGRYYSDGAVTVTSHIREAIRKGADLLLNVDSFVPFVSKEPGYVRRRGFLYNVDQDIRTLTYTRFERVREGSLRTHPNISSYTFLPANSLRRLLSINPMDHRPFLPIWRAAYLSTLRRVQLMKYRMAGDLEAHGIRLDTSRAEEVARRLRAARTPTLADFFPDGRVELRSSSRSRKRSLAASAAQAIVEATEATLSSAGR